MLAVHFSVCPVFSQTIEDAFQAFIDKRENSGLALMQFDLEKHDSLFLSIIMEAFKEADEKKREKLYSLVLAVGVKSKNVRIKNQAVKYLIKACSESEFAVRKFYDDRLFFFDKKIFKPEDKNQIVKILQDTILVSNDMILLVGYLGLKAQKKYIKNQFIESSNRKPITQNTRRYYHSKQWMAYLALARLGDKNALNYIIQQFKAEKDNFKTCTFLVKDLAYTKQEKAFRALIKLFESKKRTIPPNELSTPCNALIIPHFVKGIKNYPQNLWFLSSRNIKNENNIINWFKNNRRIVINRDVF